MNSKSSKQYTVGTLIYSKAGIISLFGWLLWGDFMLTLMESVIPNLYPLILKKHGASNQQIAIILSTFGVLINAAMNPLISFNSDRTRTRWGRRRPYILWSTPFVVLFLCLVPFASPMSTILLKVGFIKDLFSYAPFLPIVALLGLFFIGYQIFNMFVGCVYYYLIPDVVPDELMGRFMGLMRVFGMAAGFFFNYYCLPLAESHEKEIFIGIAITYGFFIYLMCLKVVEGGYPPAPQVEKTSWISTVQLYLRECFGYRIYWFAFLTFACVSFSGAAYTFNTLFLKEQLHLTMDQIGKAISYSSLISALISIPLGVLLDRWNTFKVLIVTYGLIAITHLLSYFFMKDYSSVILWSVIGYFPQTALSLVLFKWIMQVYPKDRFGQFCSAASLFTCIGAAVLGPFCGYLIDLIKDYRIIYLWFSFFGLLGALMSWLEHR